MGVVLQEGEGRVSHAQQVALLVDAAAVGHLDRVHARRVGGVAGIFRADLERAVLVGEEGGRKAHRRRIGGRLLGDLVLVEAAALVVGVEVELRPGLELLQPVVELGEAREILQLARLADDGDAKAVERLGHVGIVVVALQALRGADEGRVVRDLPGNLDRQRLRGEFGCRARLVGHRAAGQVLAVGGLDVHEEFPGPGLGDREAALAVGRRLRVLVAVDGEVVLHGLVVVDVAPDVERGRLGELRHVRGGHEVDRRPAHRTFAAVRHGAADRLRLRAQGRQRDEQRRRHACKVDA
ncbi:MAG: hypothetical protein IPH30_10925 [Betaproteobacteria bacterium]|nr:hypothetical protein [Betaproteobacteria bacterium]